MGRSRGLLERKAGAEPGTPSEVVVWWVLVEPTCVPAGAQVCVSVAVWELEATLTVAVCVCVLVCWGCQWLGPNSVIPGAAVIGGASCGGRGREGAVGAHCPRARGQRKHPPEARPGCAPAAPGRCAR